MGEKAAHVFVPIGVRDFIQHHGVGRIPHGAQGWRVDVANEAPQLFARADVARRFVLEQQRHLTLGRHGCGFRQALAHMRVRFLGVLNPPVAEDANLLGAEEARDLEGFLEEILRVLVREGGHKRIALLGRLGGHFRQIVLEEGRRDLRDLRVVLLDDLFGALQIGGGECHDVPAPELAQFTVR